jgi:hypothetical protein
MNQVLGGWRVVLAGALAFASAWLALDARASDSEPSDRAIEVGVRVGYGLPFGGFGRFGAASPDASLSQVARSQVGLGLDAGFRFGPRLAAGLSFQYGYGAIPPRTSQPAATLARSARSGTSGRTPTSPITFG